MKKLAVVGVVAGAAVAVNLVAKKRQQSESSEEVEARKTAKRREMFEKMQAGIAAMPDDFPPVVMFNNVAAIRANSDRILELLEEDRSARQKQGD
jgi:citrate synthase